MVQRTYDSAGHQITLTKDMMTVDEMFRCMQVSSQTLNNALCSKVMHYGGWVKDHKTGKRVVIYRTLDVIAWYIYRYDNALRRGVDPMTRTGVSLPKTKATVFFLSEIAKARNPKGEE